MNNSNTGLDPEPSDDEGQVICHVTEPRPETRALRHGKHERENAPPDELPLAA